MNDTEKYSKRISSGNVIFFKLKRNTASIKSWFVLEENERNKEKEGEKEIAQRKGEILWTEEISVSCWKADRNICLIKLKSFHIILAR